MPCYQPIRVAIQRKPAHAGGYRINDEQKVPCGHCLGCRALETYNWAIRLSHETQTHRHAWFITLTYDETHVPYDGSLDPEDLRDFHRTLRDSQGKLTYFGVGEYGDQESRPHYHTLCYGPDIPDLRLKPDRDGTPVFESAYIKDIWRDRGNVLIGSITMASAQYVAGYVQKKVDYQKNPDMYYRVNEETGELFEVRKEFSRMSRRPAIGKRWIQRNWREVYAHDRVVIKGVESKPPRYYDKWMETDHSEQEDNTCKECDTHRDLILKVKTQRYLEQPEADEQILKSRRKHHEQRLRLYNARASF